MRVGSDLHARMKALAEYNKEHGRKPASIQGVIERGVSRYMDDVRTGAVTYETIGIATTGPQSVRFRLPTELYNEIMELLEENKRKLSGPRTLSNLASLAVGWYVRDEEDLIEYIKKNPSQADGFKLPGE